MGSPTRSTISSRMNGATITCSTRHHLAESRFRFRVLLQAASAWQSPPRGFRKNPSCVGSRGPYGSAASGVQNRTAADTPPAMNEQGSGGVSSSRAGFSLKTKGASVSGRNPTPMTGPRQCWATSRRAGHKGSPRDFTVEAEGDAPTYSAGRHQRLGHGHQVLSRFGCCPHEPAPGRRYAPTALTRWNAEPSSGTWRLSHACTQHPHHVQRPHTPPHCLRTHTCQRPRANPRPLYTYLRGVAHGGEVQHRQRQLAVHVPPRCSA